MLVIAGVIFFIALLLMIVNSTMDVNCWRHIRILLFIALMLVIFNFYKNQQKTKETEKSPAVEIAVSE